MKILITGALGFFGLNLVRYLAGQEQTLVIMADIRQPTKAQMRFLQPVADHIQQLSLNILDRQAILACLRQYQIGYVVHTAALTPTPQQEQQQPTQIVDVNLGGTINLLDAAIQCKSVQRVLMASSSGVYGTPTNLDNGHQSEEGPLQLDNLYSSTKYSAELLMQRYSQLAHVAMAAFRLGPLYGPLEQSAPSRPRISAIGQLMQARLQGKPIRVAGPTVSRDWTYMDDAANAVLALLQAPQLTYPVYNVSCGVAVPWRAVVDAFVAHGLGVEWVEETATADIAMQPAQARAPLAIDRLRNDTGFSPQYPLAAGVAAYIAQEPTEQR